MDYRIVFIDFYDDQSRNMILRSQRRTETSTSCDQDYIARSVIKDASGATISFQHAQINDICLQSLQPSEALVLHSVTVLLCNLI